MSIDYKSLSAENQHPYLSDIFPQEKPWDTHKEQCQAMQKILEENKAKGARIEKYAQRLSRCGEWLIFAHTAPDQHERTFKLREASFCRVRTCPYCQWRRSLLYTARMLEAIPKILLQYPKMRCIHLVLTVRNCGIDKLRAEIHALGAGWKRLTQKKRVRGVTQGYVKSIEVTRGTSGDAHPHLHCLLMVPNWYFTDSSYYIPHSDWVSLWQEAMRLDYRPQVSVQACRQEKGYEKMIRELTKYTTKPQDLLADPDWLLEYIRQVHNLRFWGTGGVVREALGELERESENLIAVGEEQPTDEETLALSWFDWEKSSSRYKHKETRVKGG